MGSPWEIQRGQLSLSNELLGNGQFGQVKKGHVKRNGLKIPVAIKLLKGRSKQKYNYPCVSVIVLLCFPGNSFHRFCHVRTRNQTGNS